MTTDATRARLIGRRPPGEMPSRSTTNPKVICPAKNAIENTATPSRSTVTTPASTTIAPPSPAARVHHGTGHVRTSARWRRVPGRRDTTVDATSSATRKLTREASRVLPSRSPSAELTSGWIAPNTPAPSEIPIARIGSALRTRQRAPIALTTLRTTQRVLPIRRVRSNPCRSNIAIVALCRKEAEVFFWASSG